MALLPREVHLLLKGIKKPTNVGFLERWYPVGEPIAKALQVLLIQHISI